jgi:phosphoacetylglucosamine mutase
MDVPSWNAIYTDLPSKQLKVPVTAAKKVQIQCNEDETRLVSPTSLQQALDDAMSATPKGRCFVRPSGTEDVVRVYAEAATQELADSLAQLAVKAINDFIHS